MFECTIIYSASATNIIDNSVQIQNITSNNADYSTPDHLFFFVLAVCLFACFAHVVERGVWCLIEVAWCCLMFAWCCFFACFAHVVERVVWCLVFAWCLLGVCLVLFAWCCLFRGCLFGVVCLVLFSWCCLLGVVCFGVVCLVLFAWCCLFWCCLLWCCLLWLGVPENEENLDAQPSCLSHKS